VSLPLLGAGPGVDGGGGSLPTPTNIASVIADNSVNNVTSYTAHFDSAASVSKRVIQALQTSALSGTVTISGADGAGNSWGSPAKTTTLNTRRQAVYDATIANAITGGGSPLGTTLPLASSSTGRIHVLGFTADNIGVMDTSHAGVSGTADTFSSATGTLPIGVPGLVVSVVWKANQNALTEDAANGWTKLVENTAPGASTMSISYQVVSSTASLTHAPSWTGSVAYWQFFLYFPGA